MSESDEPHPPEDPQDAQPDNASEASAKPPAKDIARREDVRAARLETRLRRWALLGFIVAAALFWLAALVFR